MSGLKAFEVTGKALFGRTCTKKVYDKDEADKVIAELEESHKMEVEQLLMEISELQKQIHDYAQGAWSLQARAEMEIRHHKYKRCLDRVRCCMADNHTLGQVTLNESTNHLQWLFNENFFVKWAARWSKIADKFNDEEAK